MATYSIITTCMGRLEHLKQTLPRMLEQKDCEVVVVDYSCPQKTADYVREHFPEARVVEVPGAETFSNWRGRNAGAAAATGQILIFCDADTMLKPDAVEWIAANIPPRALAHFDREATLQFNAGNLRLGTNQLRGFQVAPAEAFRQMGGYDDIMEGYAAGADTDLEWRFALFGFKRLALDPNIVEDVVVHGNAERFSNHKVPIRQSYGSGFLYRKAKSVLIKMRRKPNLPLKLREKIYNAAVQSMATFTADRPVTTMKLELERETIGMPRQLGFRNVDFRMTLVLTLSGKNPSEAIPDRLDED